MRTIIFFFLFVTFLSCDKNDKSSIDIIGVWVNENRDTLSFINESLLKYSNYNPYYTTLYEYNLNGDSLSLLLAHSSNLNDRRNYYIKYSDDKFEIYNFNNLIKSTYYRIKTN